MQPRLWFLRIWGRVEPVPPPAPLTPGDMLRVMRRAYDGRFKARPGSTAPEWMKAGPGDVFDTLAPYCDAINLGLAAACEAVDRASRSAAARDLADVIADLAVDLVVTDIGTSRPEIPVGGLTTAVYRKAGFGDAEPADRPPAGATTRIVAAVIARVLGWLGFRTGRPGGRREAVIRATLADLVADRLSADAARARIAAVAGRWSPTVVSGHSVGG